MGGKNQQSTDKAQDSRKKAWYKQPWMLPVYIFGLIALLVLIVKNLENFFGTLILISLVCFLVSWLFPNIFYKLFRKESKALVRTTFGLAIIVFFVAFGITSDTREPINKNNQRAEQKTVVADNKVEQKQEETIPLLGDEFILKYDVETTNKIFIVDTEENYVSLMKSSTINDTEGYSEIFKKHAISINNGTKVRVIEYVKSDEGITYKGIKVRVLEGDKYNSVGYATRPFLKKINENEATPKNLDSTNNNRPEGEETTGEIQNSGLNVSRDNVIKTLTSNEPKLVFEKGKPMNGQDNYIASASSEGINVQLIGSQNNLSQISITLFLDTNNREQINDAFRFLGVASGTLNPSEETKKWLGSEVEYYLENKYKDYTHSKIFGNNKYEMQSILMIDIPSIILTVSYTP